MNRWTLKLAAFSVPLLVGIAADRFIIGPATMIRTTNTQNEVLPAEQELAGIQPQAIPINALIRETPDESRIEEFSDDKMIGRRRMNKVSVRCVRRNDQVNAEIEFYSRRNGKDWEKRQSFRFENVNYGQCDPRISDFNNDGLKDITFVSGQAARGANEIRTLLIYNSKTDELIHIRNSADYPNLAYNKKLDCIDAWLFHGATTTVFLKLEGEMLREFATVDTGLERVVTITRRSGERAIVRREKMNEEDIYTRYSTYDPPRP